MNKYCEEQHHHTNHNIHYSHYSQLYQIFKNLGYEPPKGPSFLTFTTENIPFLCDNCNDIDFPYKAIRDIVFVYSFPLPEKVGSIIIPDIAREKFSEFGIVLSIGKGFWDKDRFRPTSLKVGDVVIFDRDIPFEIPVLWKDKYYLVKIMGECDIRGIVTSDKE